MWGFSGELLNLIRFKFNFNDNALTKSKGPAFKSNVGKGKWRGTKTTSDIPVSKHEGAHRDMWDKHGEQRFSQYEGKGSSIKETVFHWASPAFSCDSENTTYVIWRMP